MKLLGQALKFVAIGVAAALAVILVAVCAFALPLLLADMLG